MKKHRAERRSRKSRALRAVQRILESVEMTDHQHASLVAFAILAKAFKI